MKSGLGDRNNAGRQEAAITALLVSMKSGLGDRNNHNGKYDQLWSLESQ